MKTITSNQFPLSQVLHAFLYVLILIPTYGRAQCESTYVHSSDRDDIPDYLHQVFFNIEYTEREEINGVCTVVNQKLIKATCAEKDEVYPALGTELVMKRYNEILTLDELNNSAAIALAATRIQYIFDHYHYAPDAAQVIQVITKPSLAIQYSGAFFTWANLNLGSYGYSTRQNMYIDVMTNVTVPDQTKAIQVNFYQSRTDNSLQTFVEWPQIAYSCSEINIALNSSGLCNGQVVLTPKYSMDISTAWDRTHTVIDSYGVPDVNNGISIDGATAQIGGTNDYITYDLVRSYPANTGFLIRASSNSSDTWIVEGGMDNSTWTNFGKSTTNTAVPDNPIDRSADWNFKSTTQFRYVKLRNVTGMTHYVDGLSIVNDQLPQPSYQWEKDNIIISGATSESYTATASGTYTVTVTVLIDGVPCTKSSSVSIGNASDCAVIYPVVTDNEDVQNQPGIVTQQVITEDDGDGIDQAFSGSSLDYSSFVFTTSNSQLLTVPGEGTWTFNPSNGDVTFEPEPGFTLDPTDVSYTIQDSNGNTSNVANIHVDYLPQTANDESTDNTIGSIVNINAIANDTGGDTVDISTFNFDPASVGGTGTDTDGDGDIDQVVVLGEGTWTVDNTTGVVTFNPEYGFTGNPKPIDYNIQDDENGTSNSSSITITYLSDNNTIANNDTNQTPQTIPVSGNILWNDVDYQGDTQSITSIFIDNNGNELNDANIPFNGSDFAIYGTDTFGNTAPAGSILFNNDGSYTFTPNTNFTGTIEVDYTISDNGNPEASDSATLIIDVNGANVSSQYLPIVKDDIYVLEPNQNIIMPILSNDSDLDGTLVTGSISLIPNPNTNYNSLLDADGDTTYIDVAGEGVWQVSQSGDLTFTPDAGFIEDPSPISYSVEDDEGNSDTATITITTGRADSNDMGAADDGNYGYSGETLTSSTINGSNVIDNDVDSDGSTGTPAINAAFVDSDGDGYYDDVLTIGAPTTVYGLNYLGEPTIAGVVTLNSDGTYTYDSSSTYEGTTLVHYTICDNDTNNSCANATLELTTIKSKGVISGSVSNDTDGDGNGDEGLENVTVNLYNDVDGDGVYSNGDLLHSTTITDSNGNYTFDGLPVGNYIIVETQPTDYSNVKDSDDINNGTNDNDLNTNTADDQISVSLINNEIDGGNNFVETQAEYTISGTVFYDEDELNDNTVDGIPFAPYPEVYAVLVSETGEVIATDEVDNRFSNTPGEYSFSDVSYGNNYKVILKASEPTIGSNIAEAILPAYYFSTGEFIGTGAGSDGTVDGQSSTFLFDQNINNVNFGLIYFKPDTID